MKFRGEGSDRHGAGKRLSQHRERSNEKGATLDHCSARGSSPGQRLSLDQPSRCVRDKHAVRLPEHSGMDDSRRRFRDDSRQYQRREDCRCETAPPLTSLGGERDRLSNDVNCRWSRVKREVEKRSRSPPHERGAYSVKSEKSQIETYKDSASKNRNWDVKLEEEGAGVRGERPLFPKEDGFKARDAKFSRAKAESAGQEEGKYEWGSGSAKGNAKDGKPQLKLKPTFEPSGLLAQDDTSQKEQVLEKNGVALKHFPPEDERIPDKKWRLYMFKKHHRSSVPTGDEEPTKVMYIHRKSSFLVGKDPRVADITLYHPTISKQHAAIQFRRRFEEICPYIIDLESTNGTYLNGSKVEAARYVELREGDTLRFGKSSREFVLLHSGSVDVHMSYEEFLEQRDKEKKSKDAASSVVATA